MKAVTYHHPDHNHQFVIVEEYSPHGGVEYVGQQEFKGSGLGGREVRMNKQQHEEFIGRLLSNGWKELLNG